jgi:glycosyltransferase involved in cell wall biosynthesis
MKLLVNMSVAGEKATGLGVYAAHCADSIFRAFDAELVAPATYSGLGQRVATSPDNIVLGGGRVAPLRRLFWAKRFRQPEGRLLYSPTHLAFPNSRQQILTVHDLISVRLPKNHPLQSLYFRHVLPPQLAAARAVFTVSETTRLDIHEEYGVPLDDIYVIPNGVDTTRFYPAPGPKKNFLLVVGASYFHKNVQEILNNARFWKDDYSLVIVSSRGKYREFLDAEIAKGGLQDKVQIIPYAEQAQLLQLYQTCAAFLYPSMWEGFGIPPLEALACGAKVLVSDIPVLREVLGNSAVYIQLGREKSWEEAFAMLKAAPHGSDAAEVATPIHKYTWENSAEQLVNALLKVEPSLQRLTVR